MRKASPCLDEGRTPHEGSMKEDELSIRDILHRHLSDAGFFSINYLDKALLLGTIENCNVPKAIQAKYSIHLAASAVVVSLRYSEGLYEIPSWASECARNPMLEIGRFARANWYGELMARLKESVDATIAEAKAAGSALPPANHWQRLVNSGIPEKALAEKSGAGRIGKNQILIADATLIGSCIHHSSAVVLGVLLCPVDLGGSEHAKPKDICGSCTRCIDACPTKALGTRDVFGYSRIDCIQHWTSTEGPIPEKVEKAFGKRLYGCDACLRVCPHFHVDAEATTSLGRLGPGLPASYVLGTTDTQMKKDFTGTALDRAWMSKQAFRRNAALALGVKNGC